MGNNLGGLYDTSQTELCPHREWNSPEEFLYDPSAMNVTPARTDAPKFYEIADSVLCSFSKVNAIFSYYLPIIYLTTHLIIILKPTSIIPVIIILYLIL